MKAKYRGFELEAKREKSLGGWDCVYISAYSIDTGWELVADGYTGDITVREAMKELRDTVDNYHKNPQDYDDEWEM
ncbi:hypothetical protein [Bacillus phage vB_BanS-Thrax5]|nr:hypothetical protein [Bacillus phage vB_BanS-Thrax5]